ncbi:MAG: tetratricopeptide repeat protein [Limisphaerales bacterium]
MKSLAQGQKLEAARYLFQAVKIQPVYFDALYNLGLVLQELNKTSEAVACYEQALRIDPDFAPAWNNLGVAHHSAGRSAQAADCCRRAIGLKPGDSSYYNNLANALRGMNRLTEAIHEIETALQFDATSSILRHNLGNAYREVGRIDESVAVFEDLLRAEPLRAEAHFDQAFALLLGGDMIRGWEGYEWRWRQKDHAPLREFSQPAWQGEDVKGLRLFVYAEQGAGDNIQFARYLSELARLDARVFLECPSPQVRLFGTIQGLEQVIRKGDAIPEFDRACALMSLARCFKTTIDTIPASVPYLRSQGKVPELTHVAKAETGDLKIGLVWAGNPAQKNDWRRSMPFEILRPLLGQAGVTFYSLQVPAPASGPHPLESRLVDLSPLISDYSDTAALLEQLDLVISVDTSVAHLAGALGRPVWVLLSYAPDWRWLLGRADCPWYPTMRLFRQPQPGDWAAVVSQVESELAEFERMSRITALKNTD